MGTIIFEDLSLHPGLGGGYCDVDTGEIHIDTNLSDEEQLKVAIHETLEAGLYKQYHEHIEKLTVSYIM